MFIILTSLTLEQKIILNFVRANEASEDDLQKDNKVFENFLAAI